MILTHETRSTHTHIGGNIAFVPAVQQINRNGNRRVYTRRATAYYVAIFLYTEPSFEKANSIVCLRFVCMMRIRMYVFLCVFVCVCTYRGEPVELNTNLRHHYKKYADFKESTQRGG